MKKSEICKTIIQTLSSYLDMPSTIEEHREPRHFTRKRKLSFNQLVLYLFYTSAASMDFNLDQIKEDLPELHFPSISKQAVSKARRYINPNLFKEFFNLSVDLYYKHTDTRKLWNEKYHIFAIDGTNLEIPNSKSDFNYFGEMFSYPDPDRKYTMAVASMVYDVLDDYIVHTDIAGFSNSERRFAIQHMINLEQIGIFDNSIVIFDRGYYSEDFFRYCADHGHLCLMRLKEGLTISKNCKSDDYRSSLPGNKKKNTNDIPIRIIKVQLPGGEVEYLATNIFDPDITPAMFKELYFLRWPIELKYRELKLQHMIEEFNSATPWSIFQEFYINMILSNLSALIKEEVDALITDRSKPSNKYRYQAKRSYIIGRLKKMLPKIFLDHTNISKIDALIDDAARHKSQIQPGRKYKRKGNHKGRKHFFNIKTVY